MEYGFLQRNEKGLFLVRQGKFYFVDRRCKSELKTGLCKFMVSKNF